MEERYLRQIHIPEIGPAGRNRLSTAKVTLIGAGGLGSTVLFNLAGLGVGHIRVIDSDVVSRSNLDRQFLYEEADIGMPKSAAAKYCALRHNPEITIEAIQTHVFADNVQTVLGNPDLVILAVDNAESRQIVNAACRLQNLPLLSGGVHGMFGSVQLVIPGKTACLRCAGELKQDAPALPSPPPVVSWTASLMAQCGLLWLLGQSQPVENTLFYLDGKTLSQERIPLQKAPHCPVCAEP